MKNSIVGKVIVLGIIVLFIGASVLLSAARNVEEDVTNRNNIVWDVQLNFTETGGSNDYSIFGEAPDASDGFDLYDVADPGGPPNPYINGYFATPFQYPNDKLMQEIKHYSDTTKTWNFSVFWFPSDYVSPTTTTISWDTGEVNDSEYTNVSLCDGTGTFLKNMLVDISYTFTHIAMVPQNFKIIAIRDIVYIDDNFNSTTPGWQYTHFDNIQDGINTVKENGTVYVYNGTYYENVVVNKTINLIGEDMDTTVIDGSWSGDIIEVSADWVNISAFTIRNGIYGIDINSNYNTVTNNIISNLDGDGIILGGSSNNTIAGNTISSIGEAGIYLYFYGSNNTIMDNNISNNSWGILISSSGNNTVTGNNISNNGEAWYQGEGIFLRYSSNITITGNIISNNWEGIYLYSSSNISVLGNSFFNNGLFVDDSYHNTVENNTVNGKPLVYLEDKTDYIVTDAGQVVLVNCDNITAENLNLSDADVGIELLGTNNSKIRNNDCSNNWFGIYLGGSRSNTITGNTISNNGRGIHLDYSNSNTISGSTISNNSLSWGSSGIELSGSNNTITSNIITNNEYDIKLDGSNNIITGNTISNNDNGIRLSGSSNNIIAGNNITLNWGDGIYLDWHSNSNNIMDNNISSNIWSGIILYDSSNNTITGNTISNNLEGGIIFSESSFDNTITGNTINSNNENGIQLDWDSISNTIKDNNISSNNGDGISLYYSSKNTITENNILSNDGGISLQYYSVENIITGNTIKNSDEGIYLHTSYSNTITGNNIINNWYGIDLHYSGGNSIIGNNITSNSDYGIYLHRYSYNNIIFHNNFIDNKQNAYDEGDNTCWDDGEYGNYWSDYEEKYPNASKKLLKGIWDTPYEIPGGDNKDMCPLIKQWPKPLSFIIAEKQSIQHRPVIPKILRESSTHVPNTKAYARAIG